MVTRAYLVQPETVSPPSVRDKEDTLGSIVSNKDRTMWGDASHRALSAALHVHAAAQHWAANRFSPPTVTQAKRGRLRWLACVFFFCLLPLPFFCFLPSLKHTSEKTYPCRNIFGIFPVPVEVTLFPPDEDLLTDHLLLVTPRYLKHGLAYLNCVARNINHSTGGHKTKTSYTAFITKQISDTVVCLHASISH